MPRYPTRPIWHPKSIMAETPYLWPSFIIGAGLLIIYPWRFKISRYFERQLDSPSQNLRQKSIRYYREIERLYRRQARMGSDWNMKDEIYMRGATYQLQTSHLIGVVDVDAAYFHSHKRDMLRMETLLSEIQDLKAKVAEDEKKKK